MIVSYLVILRQSSVAYMASYISRALFVPARLDLLSCFQFIVLLW